MLRVLPLWFALLSFDTCRGPRWQGWFARWSPYWGVMLVILVGKSLKVCMYGGHCKTRIKRRKRQRRVIEKPIIAIHIGNIYQNARLGCVKIGGIVDTIGGVWSRTATHVFCKEHRPARWKKLLKKNLYISHPFYKMMVKKYSLVSGGIVPVIPTLIDNNIWHVGVQEDSECIRSPCSPEQHPPRTRNSTIHKGEARVFIRALSSMCSNSPCDPFLMLCGHSNGV